MSGLHQDRLIQRRRVCSFCSVGVSAAIHLTAWTVMLYVRYSGTRPSGAQSTEARLGESCLETVPGTTKTELINPLLTKLPYVRFGLQFVSHRMFEMHPRELKNRALAAVAAAEWDGFIGTADAWAQIAKTCALEAGALAGLVSALLMSSIDQDTQETLMSLFSMF
jgi:hypothetical protein